MTNKCGIMQPYFAPYLGYFQLMEKCDNWIIFNHTQFIDKGWINRNRITNVNAEESPLWFTVPINKSNIANINQINIASNVDWRKRLTAQFYTLRKRSKYFDEASDILNKILEFESLSLSDFLVHSLKIIRKELGLSSPVYIQDLHFPDINPDLNLGAGRWALALSHKVHANIYINPIGGKSLFDHRTYENDGVKLAFFEFEEPIELLNRSYRNYSILEVIARHGLDATKQYTKLGKVTESYD